MARSSGSFSFFVPALSFALVAALVGCESTVIGGGGDGVEDDDGMSCGNIVLDDGTIVKGPQCDPMPEDDDGASDGSDGEDGEAGAGGSAPGPHALAHRTSDEPVGTTGTETTSSGQGGGTQEARVIISVANHDAATCDEPYATPACPFDALTVSVSIPASLFVVGETITLGDPGIWISFSEQGGNEGSDDCWGTGVGGGTGEPGTLSIDAHGQGTIDVTFTGTAYDLLEGAHTAVFCD